MAQIVSPPPTELRHLRPPLNGGEKLVLDALVRHLDEAWEIFVQPKLHTKEPDFVVAHPDLGVTVVEVKAWNPDCYRVAQGLLEVRDGRGWQPCGEQPRWQCHGYRNILADRFFFTPDADPGAFPLVRGIVVLPFHATHTARSLLEGFCVSQKDEKYVCVYGKDAFASAQGVRKMIGHSCHGNGMQSPLMRREYLKRLRRHLCESEWISDQRRPLSLSQGARDIEKNPRNARARRTRGPAGSGKTIGLAARSAALAKQGKTVLILCFNIALPHYIQDLAARRCRQIGAQHRLIRPTHFHGFCRDVIDRAGVRPAEPATETENSEDPESRYDRTFLQAKACYENPGSRRDLPRFDAILVDEGQDFRPDWWNFLRLQVCKPGGELLLVVDTTQDLYGRSSWVREEKMPDAGFSGPWTELRGSYRTPTNLVPLLAHFAQRYIPGDVDPPSLSLEQEQRALFAPDELERCNRRWIQVSTGALPEAITSEVLRLLDTHDDLHPDDIVFLVEDHKVGLAVAATLEEKGVAVTHIFTEADGTERRRRKMRFWGGYGGMKGCTVHSFKGWEARAVVVGVDSRKGSHRLAYVAMSRVKGQPSGRPAFLSVVCSDLRLAAFGDAVRLAGDEGEQCAGDFSALDLDEPRR